jgi:gluconate 2-dehydrogenase gamma chain
MTTEGISRRDVLKTLTMGVAGGGVLQVIPLEAAELAHQMVHKEKAAAPAGKYAPKYFTAKQYEALNWLCDAILPKDEKSGGALEAGAPEFIDLLTSENEDYQAALGG